MCYDMSLRALDDAIQTFGSMKYRHVGEDQASQAAQTEVAGLVEQLRQIRQRLAEYEGAHLDETVKCNACNVYHHHNHDKTEWRGQASRGGCTGRSATPQAPPGRPTGSASRRRPSRRPCR